MSIGFREDDLAQDLCTPTRRCGSVRLPPKQQRLPVRRDQPHDRAMSTKSRESIYGATIRMSAERAKEARREADRLASEAWNYRMLGYKSATFAHPG
jgi:hypothetical protein